MRFWTHVPSMWQLTNDTVLFLSKLFPGLQAATRLVIRHSKDGKFLVSLSTELYIASQTSRNSPIFNRDNLQVVVSANLNLYFDPIW